MFTPYMECRTLENATASAGATAAIAVFFNPVVGAIFGALAGLGAVIAAGSGC